MKTALESVNKNPFLFFTNENVRKYRDVLFAIAVVCIIGVLLFPVPTMLIDLLLSLSITLSVLILMTVLFIDRPLDFSSFPTVLLIVTMLRLALNIATTRLILGNGHMGPDAAGHVVEAFGFFVMRGSIIIGAIVFGILTIINFVVITKGSGRIAEVAARFSLDAMPGKQMAIDADLSAGLIDETAAKARRKDIEDESTFFGSMDGANKFVRGDAVAGLLIIFINFIAGMLIGIVQKSMTFEFALKTYTLLTIGDGLVSQVPALIVSIAAGLLVTKSGVQGSADKAIFEQLGKYPQAMMVSSGLLLFISLMPGIPMLPFMTMGAVIGSSGYYLFTQKLSEKEGESTKDVNTALQHTKKPKTQEEVLSEALQIDIIKLEIGYALLNLVNIHKGQKLTDQIKVLREQIARDLGFLMPSVRVQDNLQLGSNTYVVKIKDIQCGTGNIMPDKLLIMEQIGQSFDIPGEDVKEPAFGLNARWIDENKREEAVYKKYTVVDPTTVITTHLTEIVKENIVEMLSYSAVQKLIDNLPTEHKKIVADMIPTHIPMATLHRVLQGLLQENVSIRDLPTILEALSEITGQTKNLIRLIDHVRARLSKQICAASSADNGYIPILTLSPAWEQVFTESLVGEGDEKQLVTPPSKLQEFALAVNKEYDKQVADGELCVLVTTPHLRSYVRMIIERFRPAIQVLSQSEIHVKAKIKTLGQVS